MSIVPEKLMFSGWMDWWHEKPMFGGWIGDVKSRCLEPDGLAKWKADIWRMEWQRECWCLGDESLTMRKRMFGGEENSENAKSKNNIDYIIRIDDDRLTTWMRVFGGWIGDMKRWHLAHGLRKPDVWKMDWRHERRWSWIGDMPELKLRMD